MTPSSRLAGRLGIRSEVGAEVISHQLDLLRGPQAAAPDHAMDRGFPSTAILPLVAEHRIGVALKALAHYHAASGMLRSLLLPGVLRRCGRGQQQRRAGEHDTNISPEDHRVSLQCSCYPTIARSARLGRARRGWVKPLRDPTLRSRLE